MTDLVKAAAAATAAATGATSKPSTSRAKNVDDIDDIGLVEFSLTNDNYRPDRVAQVYARHKAKVIV